MTPGGFLSSQIAKQGTGSEDAGGPDVWPIFRDYREFGRFTIESISYAHDGHPDFVGKLNEAELGDLNTWLLLQYPLLLEIIESLEQSVPRIQSSCFV
jgi:hypothetical protein